MTTSHWKTWEEYHEGAPPEYTEPELYKPPTLYRLNRLVASGYVPQFQISDDGSPEYILFLHPRRTFEHYDLQMDEVGWVYGNLPDSWSDKDRMNDDPPEKQLRIAPDDGDEFEAFARTVPAPTFWEKHASVIGTIGGCLVVLISVTIAFVLGIVGTLAFGGVKMLIDLFI